MTDTRKLARLGIHVLDGGALTGTGYTPQGTPVPVSALREGEGEPIGVDPSAISPRVRHGRSHTAGGRPSLSSTRSAPDVGDLAVTGTTPMPLVLPGEPVRAGAPLDVFISSAKRARFTITVAVWAVLIGLSLAAWAFVGFLVYLGAFT